MLFNLCFSPRNECSIFGLTRLNLNYSTASNPFMVMTSSQIDSTILCSTGHKSYADCEIVFQIPYIMHHATSLWEPASLDIAQCDSYSIYKIILPHINSPFLLHTLHMQSYEESCRGKVFCNLPYTFKDCPP